MVPWLRMLTALVEDLRLLPKTHVGWLIATSNFSSRGSVPSSALSGHPHTIDTQTHINKNKITESRGMLSV